MPLSLSTFGNPLSLRVDGAIGAMTLLPSGRDAVLAGRRGVFVIDLDDPFLTPRWLHHITLWEVADVQWSPHHNAKPLWCVLTLNQKALLWDLSRPSSNAIINVLHAHTRAISDINFHPLDPELLATCLIDTFALAWDMRAPRTPAMKWAEWRAGATQVKWSGQNPWQLATAHDHLFYVWDYRKGALPVVKIHRAHLGKINGLDFLGGMEAVITLSNDCKVKHWDLTTPKAQEYLDSYNYFTARGTAPFPPQVTIETLFPIAKARLFPFGADRACGIMPLRGGNHAIHIANYQTLLDAAELLGEPQTVDLAEVAVHEYEGHTGVIKDFLWRPRRQRYSDGLRFALEDFQLVTWSLHDDDLRLWPNDGADLVYGAVNYHPARMGRNMFGEDSDDEYQAHYLGIASTEATPEPEEEPQKGPTVYNYCTYLNEPPVSIEDMARLTGGDTLSLLALLALTNAKTERTGAGTINHLDWILGVRMGRKVADADGLPMNLGEEISIVGKKFPKVRFEKISVSTGQIVVSFKGVLPETARVPEPADYNLTFDDDTATVALGSKKEELESKDEPREAKPTGDSLVFMRLTIDFPQAYPFLPAEPKGRARARHTIRFRLEETHELNSEAIAAITAELNDIAEFFANKHHRFCLEPCLRLLMGDKIELDDEALAVVNPALDAIEEVELDVPLDIPSDAGLDMLLMMVLDLDLDHIVFEPVEEARPLQNVQNYDLTPVPKGCGATWSVLGQLVCFFIPKDTQPEEADLEDSDVLNAGDDLDDDLFQEEWDAIIAADSLRGRVPALFKTVVGLGNEYSGLGRARLTGGTTGNPLLVRKAKTAKQLNMVGIFDFSHLIPSKIDLAHQYRILGDAPERLARYNSDVAASFGDSELANTWKLLEMILVKDVDTLGTLPLSQFQFEFEKGTMVHSTVARTMFFWGHHPLGHPWLIRQLFAYYERKNNVQMLAMMACILHENSLNLRQDEELLKVPIHTPYQAMPPVSALGPVVAPTGLTALPVGSNGTGGYGGFPFSHGPSYSGVNTGSGSPYGSHVAPLPLQIGPAPYGSFPGLGATSVHGSFKDQLPFMTRLNSDVHRLNLELVLAPPPAVARLLLVILLPQLQRKNSQKKSVASRPPPEVSITMHNMETLDIYEDTYLCGLLLLINPSKLRQYRREYANLLYFWGLPVNRIKILKFNYTFDDHADPLPPEDDMHKCHIALRLRRKQNPRHAFVNLVTFIELSKLNPWNLGKRNVLKYCNLCAMVVVKNFVVCTLCEHILHTECAFEWWNRLEQDECPSGCGCNCLDRPFSA